MLHYLKLVWINTMILSVVSWINTNILQNYLIVSFWQTYFPLNFSTRGRAIPYLPSNCFQVTLAFLRIGLKRVFSCFQGKSAFIGTILQIFDAMEEKAVCHKKLQGGSPLVLF